MDFSTESCLKQEEYRSTNTVTVFKQFLHFENISTLSKNIFLNIY